MNAHCIMYNQLAAKEYLNIYYQKKKKKKIWEIPTYFTY